MTQCKENEKINHDLSPEQTQLGTQPEYVVNIHPDLHMRPLAEPLLSGLGGGEL